MVVVVEADSSSPAIRDELEGDFRVSALGGSCTGRTKWYPWPPPGHAGGERKKAGVTASDGVMQLDAPLVEAGFMLAADAVVPGRQKGAGPARRGVRLERMGCFPRQTCGGICASLANGASGAMIQTPLPTERGDSVDSKAQVL